MSTPQVEGVLHVAKSLKYQVLLDIEEMRSLLDALPAFVMAIVSEPVSLEEGVFSKEVFLEKYAAYVRSLKNGEVPEESSLRRYFTSVITVSPEDLYVMDVGRGRYLIKPIRPVIQLQLHHFFYSSLDQKFHPLIQGKESITWGVQISYPQIAQDPQTKAIHKVEHSAPNTEFFTQLGRWLREHSRPTPFVAEGKRSNEPIRIGRQCFSWIAKHPQLKAKGIQILGSEPCLL